MLGKSASVSNQNLVKNSNFFSFRCEGPYELGTTSYGAGQGCRTGAVLPSPLRSGIAKQGEYVSQARGRNRVNIVALTAYHVRIPLRRRIRHASHTRTETDNLLVRCVLEDGSTGYGEGVPRDYVTGETIDSSLDLLKRSDIAAQRAGCRDF